ncbi:MAG: hypothetical protein IOMNBAOH_02349 [Rhodocyclaceae bacterium]|nr:site-2 protease family protein [Rhodocyclaceae bacterium]MCG3187695.1 hypothetical protein [Rhodocyclaceae bacterium]
MEEAVGRLITMALPVVLAITLHEAAHGYMARRFGDPTAWLAGRISLNPLKHVDPVGTIAVPLVMFAVGAASGQPGLVFGWAKPVPVDFSRLRDPKRNMLWVAAAGPLANLAMACAWASVWKLSMLVPTVDQIAPIVRMADVGLQVNAILMMLNLLPILPLDGGRILASLLPSGIAVRYVRLEPWGLPILILLLIIGALDAILIPLVTLFEYLTVLTFGLHL